MNAVSISALEKKYGTDMWALKGIDLTVPEGDFFALLGPNGAGKSTAIGIICSLVNKTSGSVSIFDYDLEHQREAAKAIVGLVPQEFNFNVFEPVLPTLLNVAGYNGIERPEAMRRAEFYLKKLDLWDKRKSPSRELSGGMKRRLMIARALIHEPRLLILDEPTAGVDLEIRRSMWEFLTELNEQHGTTIILTTHYLEEAEALCRNVAIIDQGKIIEQGAVSQLLSRSMMETFVLDTSGYPEQLPELAPFTLRVRDSERLEVDVPKGQSINMLFQKLSEHDIEVSSLRNKSNRLEEFFMRLVNQKQGQSS